MKADKSSSEIVIRIGEKDIRIPFPLEIAREKNPEALAGEILSFGLALAGAREQEILIDAEYRQWRAVYSSALLDRDRKISEWKIRSQLEATEEFMRFKQGQALVIRNVLMLQAVIDAYQARLDSLT